MPTSLTDNLPDVLKTVRTRPLFVMRLDVRKLQIIGATPGSYRRIGVVPGGVFEGVLWRTDASFDFVIEAKSEKEEDNPLYKKEHAQLLEAEQWFKVAYPNRSSIRVSALPEAVADDKATADGTFALRLTEITKLVGTLRAVLAELVAAPGSPVVLRERCEVAPTRSSSSIRILVMGRSTNIPRCLSRT